MTERTPHVMANAASQSAVGADAAQGVASHGAVPASDGSGASDGFAVETDAVVSGSGLTLDERHHATSGGHAPDALATDDAMAPNCGSDDVIMDGHETFIPVTRFALFERLTAPGTWPVEQRDDAIRFFKYLAAWRHQTYMERLLTLKEAYLPFSPDRDTVRDDGAVDRRDEQHGNLVQSVSMLLERANYAPIDKGALDDIFSEDSAYGLDLSVDLYEFDDVLIYYRGACSRTFRDRTWRKLWLGFEERHVPSFRRLFLLLKLKPESVRIDEIMATRRVSEKRAQRIVRKARRMMPDDVSSDFIYLKLFKDIPRADVRMLFPNTRVKFKLLDKLKLGVTAGGGTIASIVSTASKVIAAVNPIAAIMAIIALVGVVWRQVMKFFNQRNQYMMVLAQNLYFHTLADNRGVLTLLCDRAEEEDIKEEMLLYALLAKAPLHSSQLDDARAAIEEYLHEEFGVRVRYDLFDALARLRADEVVVQRQDGMLIAMAPRDACLHIDAKWDRYLDDAEFFRPPPGRDQQATAATSGDAQGAHERAAAHKRNLAEGDTITARASAHA